MSETDPFYESQIGYTRLLCDVVGWNTLDPANPRHLVQAFRMAGLKLVREGDEMPGARCKGDF